MNIQLHYQRPSDLRDAVVAAVLGITTMDVDGVRKVVLTANAMSKVCAIDLETAGILTQLLDTKASGIFGGLTGTLVAAKYTSGTSLTVVDDDGFADLDPIAVVNVLGGTVYYGQVDGAPAANVITLQHDLAGTCYKNAWVVNLKDMLLGAGGVGFNHAEGVKAQHEAPPAPAFTVDDGALDTIDVDITDPGEDSALYFDVYVRKQATRPTRLEPNWEPDAKDKTIADIASSVNISTYGGGPDFVPDGAGGDLATTNVVWVGVVAKDGTGITDVKRSVCDWVTHTLD